MEKAGAQAAGVLDCSVRLQARENLHDSQRFIADHVECIRAFFERNQLGRLQADFTVVQRGFAAAGHDIQDKGMASLGSKMRACFMGIDIHLEVFCGNMQRAYRRFGNGRGRDGGPVLFVWIHDAFSFVWCWMRQLASFSALSAKLSAADLLIMS